MNCVHGRQELFYQFVSTGDGRGEVLGLLRRPCSFTILSKMSLSFVVVVYFQLSSVTV